MSLFAPHSVNKIGFSFDCLTEKIKASRVTVVWWRMDLPDLFSPSFPHLRTSAEL